MIEFWYMKTILILLAAFLIIGGGYYWYSQNEQTGVNDFEIEEVSTNNSDSGTLITWRLEDAGETDNIPYTNVKVMVNGSTYDMGKFQGSCAEIGASGGVDGQGLLAGEISAVQCWYAGGGDEIGVFAQEDGGYDIMVGSLDEGIEGGEGFRGDFEIVHTLEESNNTPEAKLNIDVVCEGALAYMSFPDAESAAEFVAECKAGEHPEVIERYKAEMNLGAEV